MKRRILAITLTLALLMGVFATTGLSVGAADNLVVTYAKYLPDGTNFLKGKTPVSGWNDGDLGDGDAARLVDGVYSATATDGWQAPFAAGSRLVYNLGGIYVLDKFLVSSVGDAAKYAKEVTIYVADTKEALFTSESLAVTTTLMEKGGRITMPGETIQHSCFSILGKSYRGRYVGFDFSSAANKAVFGDTISLGELGIYGKVISGAPQVEMVTEVPNEENLLLEATVTSAYTGKTPSTHSGNMGAITDGMFAEDENGRWNTHFNNGDRLTWELGQTATIYKFLIGSEVGLAERITKAKIYVSDTKDNLYTDDTLKADVTLAGQNNTITITNGNITGRYVGFDFSESCENHGGPIRYFFRLGELGVYGLTEPELEASNDVNGVKLTWDDNFGADGYYIYRSQNIVSSWTEWDEIGCEQFAGFEDTTAVNGEEYRYQVIAYRGDDKSAPATTDAIRRLTACQVKAKLTSGKVRLTWNANTMVDNYIVYRQYEDGDYWSDWEKQATVSATTYTDTSLKKGVNYRYAVSAVSGKASSMLIETDAVMWGTAATTPGDDLDTDNGGETNDDTNTDGETNSDTNTDADIDDETAGDSDADTDTTDDVTSDYSDEDTDTTDDGTSDYVDQDTDDMTSDYSDEDTDTTDDGDSDYADEDTDGVEDDDTSDTDDTTDSDDGDEDDSTDDDKKPTQSVTTDSSFPWWGWLLIGLGVLAAAGAVVVVLLVIKKKKQTLEVQE